jgi:predicted AAA+ superfamily ATPase
LLENLVALSLFRKYGHDHDNERVFFYNDKVEVDFYVPDDQLAIQVSFSITQSPETYAREVDALKKLPNAFTCKRRLILTYDESDTITDSFGTIEVMPLWRWLLQEQNND